MLESPDKLISNCCGLPAGAPKFIPKIYGFKIFGMRGSKYELKFDYAGKPMNEEEIRKVL